jgi:DNA helicase-2/ATP-dependent DNA helicase PcrA
MDLLQGLNPQQIQAVTAAPGPVLILAGPGSGKTRVLTHRFAYGLQELGIPPEQMLAVTFTNKAAREMRSRVLNLLEIDGASEAKTSRSLRLGTFHSFAARALRNESAHTPLSVDYVIYDEDDQLALVRQILKDLNQDPKKVSAGAVLNQISRAKNELIPVEDFASNSYFGEIVKRVYGRYQQALIRSNARDFDDLLLDLVSLLRNTPELLSAYRDRYRHLLVDEFQDTNTAQYGLLRLLAGEQPDLFVVGDPDQSIYRWRGADYRNVHRFQQDYPEAEVILLEQNYRSTQTVLDAAMAVIDRQPGRRQKKLFTERGLGAPIVIREAYDEIEEASFVLEAIASLTLLDGVEPGDCAVMYRTNAQSRVLEEAFLKTGLPYRLVGAQRFYGRREIKDAIAYLRLVHNPSDQVSLSRVLNTPPRGIGTKSREALISLARRLDRQPAELLLEMAEGGELEIELQARGKRALTDFGRLLLGWTTIRDQLSLNHLLERILTEVGYREYIEDGSEPGAERWANIIELLSVTEEFSDLGLGEFLEHVALISDQDTLTDGLNAPTLLTLHAAKGLEFGAVIIVGLDQGILPHQRSIELKDEDPEALAEERRLFYVGVTRAKDHLLLVRAFRRRIMGSSILSEPSRFLDDLPADLLQGDLIDHWSKEQAVYARQTSWDSPPSTKTSRAPVRSKYHAGLRVRHPKFGEGRVTASNIEGGEEEVTVEFNDGDERHLVASYAGLEILEED